MEGRKAAAAAAAAAGARPAPRRSLHTLPWNATFAQEANRLAAVEGEARQAKLLRELSNWLRVDCFAYPTREAELAGKSALLKIWKVLLDSLLHVSELHREDWFEAIAAIMLRYEFDLVFLAAENGSDLAAASDLDLKLARLFRRHTVRTFRCVVATLSVDGRLGVAVRRFAAQVLALAFFRLPLLCGVILDAACGRLDAAALARADDAAAQARAARAAATPDRGAQPAAPAAAAAAAAAAAGGRSPESREEEEPPQEDMAKLTAIAAASERRHSWREEEGGDDTADTDATESQPQADQGEQPQPPSQLPESEQSPPSEPEEAAPVLVVHAGTPASDSPELEPADAKEGPEAAAREAEAEAAEQGDAAAAAASADASPAGKGRRRGSDEEEEEEEEEEEARRRREVPAWHADLMAQLRRLSEAETMAARAAFSASTWFFQRNPGLFQWLWFNNPRDHQLVAESQRTLAMRFRDRLFCLEFVRAVMVLVRDTAHGEVVWSLVPGYWALVAAALERVLESPGPQLPLVMACLDTLAENHALLPVLVQAALRTTSALNKLAVNQTLESVHRWVSMACPDMSDPLPDSFCFDVLFDALSLLLELDHFHVLLKTLWFVYMNAGRLPNPQRKRMFAELLLKRYFFKLFCHWSPEVRRVFHLILIFRIRRKGRLAHDARKADAHVAHDEDSPSLVPHAAAAAAGIVPLALSPLSGPSADAAAAGAAVAAAAQAPLASPQPLALPQQHLAHAQALPLPPSSPTNAATVQLPAAPSTSTAAAAAPPRHVRSVSAGVQATQQQGVEQAAPQARARSTSDAATGVAKRIAGPAAPRDSRSFLARMSDTLADYITSALPFLQATGGRAPPTAARLRESDPKLDNCAEIVSVLTTSAVETDNMLMARLRELLHVLQQHVATPERCPLPSNERVWLGGAARARRADPYAAKALAEFREQRLMFQRLQGHARKGGVLTPELFFDAAVSRGEREL